MESGKSKIIQEIAFLGLEHSGYLTNSGNIEKCKGYFENLKNLSIS
jgi:hypothetical protein